MKRLFIIASLAILAVGCQKTFVENEVQTPIGFSTEVGKQTRAIVSDSKHPIGQQFGVFAYGHQTDALGSTNIVKSTTIMDDVNIKGENASGKETWKAGDGFTYYWPNDPRTYINFYAYSPRNIQGTAPHQNLTAEVEHRETAGTAQDGTTLPAGLTMTDYVHSNMYVDFMVSRPVLKATYADQDGGNGSEEDLESVPVSFNHQMTQIVFKVQTKEAYSDVEFTVNSITLNNIYDKADYAHETLTPSYLDTDSKFTHGAWTDHEITKGQNDRKGTFQIFPAFAYAVTAEDGNDNTENGSPDIEENQGSTKVTNTTVLTTTPVTMIPQKLATSVKAAEGVTEVKGQSFTINYSIKGKGVADETVIKTIDFRPTGASTETLWGENKKITYVVTIGMNEITFAPTVVGWSQETADDIYKDNEVTVQITPEDKTNSTPSNGTESN